MQFIRNSFLFILLTGVAQATLIAQYSHESVDPLEDDAGQDHNLVNDGVTFIAPVGSTGFQLGSTIGDYHRAGGTDFVDAPGSVYGGQSFTFTALVRRDSTIMNTGHQTILATDRFRFQWRIDRPGGVPNLATQQLTIGINNGGSGGSSPGGTFPSDTWFFTALRYDHTTHTIDAWLQDSTLSTLGAPILQRPANVANDLTDIASAFRIGDDGLSLIGGEDPFDGWIDGARIYDTALSDAEVNGVFAFMIPEPGTAGLILVGAGVLGLVRRRAVQYATVPASG